MTKEELNERLLDAAFDGDILELKECLLFGADVNAKHDSGWTALMYAATNGRTEIVDTLLKLPGINVNAKSTYGSTALMWAAERGRTAIVEALLKVPGIDVNAKPKKNGRTALKRAVIYGHPEIAELLKEAGAV